MKLFFGLVAAALAFAAFCDLPLAYDGAWYFIAIVDKQAVHAPFDRYVNYLLDWPLIAATYLTSNVRILRLIFSVTNCLLPLLNLLACWWMLDKERRSLFIWPAIASCIAVMPSLSLFVGESTIADKMVWLLWLAVLSGMNRRAMIVAVPASIILFLSHPMAMPYFVGCAVLSCIMALLDRADRRRMYITAATFTALAALRFVVFVSSAHDYEQNELSLAMQLQHYRNSAAGLPTDALLLAGLGGLLVFLRANFLRVQVRTATAVRIAGIAALSAAGFVFMRWASDGQNWRGSLDFRDLTPFSSGPFLLFAAWEGVFGVRKGASGAQQANPEDLENLGEWEYRRFLVQVVGAIFLVVFSIQSTVWYGLRSELVMTMSTSQETCIEGDSLPWIGPGPLYHWATPMLSLALQDRAPQKIVLSNRGCADLPQSVAHWKELPRGGGWLDLSKIDANAR